jgi:DNA polymerase-3 subunit beta
VNAETQMVVITSQNGRFSIPGQNGSDFPQIPQIREDKKASIQMAPGLLMSGITKAIFATADDELRPVMNGIYVELSPSDITFVASDAHKLVRYRRTDAQSEVSASFILSKKPASLLKNVLGKEENLVTLEFDDKNAFFTLTNYKMVCRLIEGTYPSFNAVIPQNNPNKVIVDRVELLNTLRRVSVYANQASNLIKLDIKNNEMMVSAQDIDFSISAYERIGCQYDGDEMEIGFKSSFLIEILANLASGDVVFELSDPARAGLVLPLEKEIEEEDVLMLLMPMMINA